MGTEHEVTGRADTAKKAFLSQDHESIESESGALSLEEAFNKTKNNNNSRLYLAISVLLVLLASVSASFHYYMRILENSVEINIAEFDDVRLKEAIFSIGNTSIELDLLRSELVSVVSRYQNKLVDLENEYSRRAELYKLQGKDADLGELQIQRDEAINKLKEESEKEVRLKARELAALENKNHQAQKKLSSSRMDILNPEQKLQSLRVGKVQDYYESRIEKLKQDFAQEKKELTLKYNPKIKNPELESVFKRVIKSEDNTDFNKEQSVLLVNLGAASDTDLELIMQLQKEQKLLVDGLRSIPFVNMPQTASEHLQKLNEIISGQYVNLTDNLLKALNNKSGEIGSYEFMMSDMVARLKSDGLIVDPSDKQNIVVYFRKDYNLKEGDRFAVFRYETSLNIQMRVSRKKGELIITQIDSSPIQELLPFDKLILLQ